MYRHFLRISLIGIFAFGIGCSEPDPVRQYRIPKSRSDLGDIGTKKLPVTSAPPGKLIVDARMVVAISQRSDATWFFKITGPTEAVTDSQPDWQSILKSVTFGTAGNPDWTLAPNWKLGPPKAMRFATLTIETEIGPVEMSISSLGPNQNLLQNVNRWREQLGLGSIEEDDLQLGSLAGDSGDFKVFDETGKLQIGGSMASTPARQPDVPVMKYDLPPGWIESRKSRMVPVRLRHGEEKSAPQITVTQLLAAANEWLPNAQRWADQIGFPEDEETLDKVTEELAIDSISGQIIRLIPDDEESKYAIIGAMVVREDIAWFFKFIGEKEFVKDNQQMFDQFLQSFQFDQG